jgi:hypothetical protein
MQDDKVLSDLDMAIHHLATECAAACIVPDANKDDLKKLLTANKDLIISLAQMRDLSRVR